MSLTPAYRFEVRKSITGSWYWCLMARNGNLMAGAGEYSTRSGAVRAVKAVKRAAAVAYLA